MIILQESRSHSRKHDQYRQKGKKGKDCPKGEKIAAGGETGLQDVGIIEA